MIKYYSYFPKVDSLQVHLKCYVESRNISHGFWCRLRCIELCLKAQKSNILISTNQRPMRLLLSGHLTCRPRSSRPSGGTPPRQRDCPRICSSPGWFCWSGRSPSRVARGSPTDRSRRPTAPAYTCRQPEFCSLLAFTPTMAFYLLEICLYLKCVNQSKHSIRRSPDQWESRRVWLPVADDEGLHVIPPQSGGEERQHPLVSRSQLQEVSAPRTFLLVIQSRAQTIRYL